MGNRAGHAFISYVREDSDEADELQQVLVLRRLIECLARDRGGGQVVEVTSLGLVHMTRRRVGYGRLVAARP